MTEHNRATWLERELKDDGMQLYTIGTEILVPGTRTECVRLVRRSIAVVVRRVTNLCGRRIHRRIGVVAVRVVVGVPRRCGTSRCTARGRSVAIAV